jgi:hypothetical protein
MPKTTPKGGSSGDKSEGDKQHNDLARDAAPTRR